MKFSKLETQNKILIISFVIFLGLYFLLTYRQKPQQESKIANNKLETADTYIPAGHVLVPIEIENVESVSGIIGAFALVDLYTRPPQALEMFLVAQKIKLIRAPLNPNQYAVLVTESQSVDLLKINPRFWVTIHNQKNSTKPVTTLIASASSDTSSGAAAHSGPDAGSSTGARTRFGEVTASLALNSEKVEPQKKSERIKGMNGNGSGSKNKKVKINEEILIEYYESKKARYL